MRYTRLAFNGGGMKGLAFCGALESLETFLISQNRSIASELEHVAGASIGAFVGMLLCMRVPDIRKELISFKFQDLSMNIANFPENWCILQPNFYQSIVRTALTKYIGDPEITFQQFSQRTGCRLTVTVSCLNPIKPGHFIQYHDTELTPDYKVWRSVTASGSIPLILSPVTKDDGEVWVDGGLLDNIALNLFPSDMNNSLSFQLVQSPKSVDSLYAYIYHLFFLFSIIETHKSIGRLTDTGKQHIVKINTGNVNSWDIHLDSDTQSYLIESGKKAMERFLHPGDVIKDCLNFLLKDISALLSSVRSRLSSTSPSEQTVVVSNNTVCSNTPPARRRHSWPYSLCEEVERLFVQNRR